MPQYLLNHSLVFASTVLLVSCSTLPNVNRYLYSPASIEVGPDFYGAHGPLSTKQGEAIIAKLKQESQAGDHLLQRHLAIEQALSGSALVVGNKVSLLVNGPATYAAMFKAIRQAKHNINVETYILEDNALSRKIADLLIRKRSEGLQINIIYDAFGSMDTPQAYLERLRKAGIQLLEFNPIDPLEVNTLSTINNRDHRKLLIVDGRIVFTGGINLGAEVSGIIRDDEPRNEGKLSWRDTDVRIQGPAAAEFQQFFIQHWNSQKGPHMAPSLYFPPLHPAGKQIVRAIASTSDDPVPLIYATLISAIHSAKRSVHITDAYFAPDERFIVALKEAARRGVDVTMILPRHSDSWLALAAGHSHYTELLEAGIGIYERRDYVLHAKTIVIDDVWSTIGTTNLDWRSFRHNDEINAVILGYDFARQMEALFRSDLAHSQRIKLQQWRQRSLWERFLEATARLWEWWL